MKKILCGFAIFLLYGAIITGCVLVGVYQLEWLLLSLLAGIFLVLLLTAMIILANPEPCRPIIFVIGALGLVGAAVGVGFFSILAPVFITGGYLFLIGAIWWAKRHEGYAFGGNWHLIDKGLGGSIFGDIANMVGVFAGIGAYRLVSENAELVRAWWWIGQVGAYLAAAVSLSLLWRWANSAAGSGEGIQKWPALFNWSVAMGTIVSLYAPTDANRLIAGLQEGAANDFAGVVAGGIWLALLIILIVVYVVILVKGIKRGRFWISGQARFVTVAFILIAIASYTAVGFAIAGARSGQDWTTAGTVIAMIAVLAWIGGEFFNYFKLTGEWKENNTYISVVDYLDWEKNFWEFIGGAGTIMFVAGNTWRPEWQSYNDILFIVAASLGFLGTLRGILRGVLKRLYRDDYTRRVGADIVSLRAQVESARERLQITMTTSRQLRGVQRGEINQRDQQIQQQQHTVQMQDGQILALRQEVQARDDRVRVLEQNIQERVDRMQALEQNVIERDGRIQELERGNARLTNEISSLRKNFNAELRRKG